MNILFVTYTAYPSLSGRITFLTILKKNLEKLGHKVDILAHAPGLNEFCIVKGQRVVKHPLKKHISTLVLPLLEERYPGIHPWIKWREIERYTFEAAIRQFDLSQYNIIHVHDIYSSLACQRVVKNKPIVASFHNCKVEELNVVMEQGNIPPMVKNYVAREEYLSINRPHKVTVPSRWLQEAFSRLSIEKSKINVVPYGMDVEEFLRSMKSPTGIDKPKDRKVILCPARLVPIKGNTYLFQALEQLQKEDIQIECWIAGNGVLESKLRQEVTNRKLADVVRFLGERQDIPALMALSDLIVLPTLHDTSPLVIMEAQVAGVPVISTTVGGVMEMVKNGKSGLIGPPRDPAYLYKAIREMLSTPVKAKKMADEVQRDSSQIWEIQKVVERTVNIYQEALDENQPSPENSESFSLDEELLEPVYALGGLKKQEAMGKVIGSVSSQEGYPLRSATVHLSDISQISIQTGKCDEEGYFSFPEIPAGKFALIVTKDGRWSSHHLIVQEGEVSICHVVL